MVCFDCRYRLFVYNKDIGYISNVVYVYRSVCCMHRDENIFRCMRPYILCMNTFLPTFCFFLHFFFPFFALLFFTNFYFYFYIHVVHIYDCKDTSSNVYVYCYTYTIRYRTPSQNHRKTCGVPEETSKNCEMAMWFKLQF